jgi:CheY-like chemotaxis protein
MPICDGIEATKKIREFERTSLNPSETTDKASERTQDSHSAALLPKSHQVNFGVPIIAVSASLHERQREDIFKAGMDGWILKPVDFNRLATLMIASIDVSIRAGLVYKLSMFPLFTKMIFVFLTIFTTWGCSFILLCVPFLGPALGIKEAGCACPRNPLAILTGSNRSHSPPIPPRR